MKRAFPTTASAAAWLLPCALLLGACGGGGSLPVLPDGSAKPELTGEVASIDGLASGLEGVVLTLRETNDLASTAADGWFSFGAVPAGTLTLDLLPASAFALRASTAAQANGDGVMRMEQVRETERVHVRLRLADGAVGETECVRAENAWRETVRRMVRAQANGDPDLGGGVGVAEHAAGQQLRVSVQGAAPGLDLVAELVAPDGRLEALGPATVGGDGTCDWSADSAAGGRLPFDAARVESLERHRVRVRAAGDAAPLLEGDVPGLPADVDEARREQLRLEMQQQEQERQRNGGAA